MQNQPSPQTVKVIDIEQLLADGHAIQIHPRGTSMYPLFVPGRDEAIISPLPPEGTRRLKRGEIVLYRREGSILVLHRIWKINQKGVYLVGDNQTEIEGPLKHSQIRGVVTSFIRNGRKVSVHHPIYALYSHIWLFLRPCRKKIVFFRQKISLFQHFFQKNSE